ncbi:ladderlectin-like [Oncorhynchus kisutch]|uniref:ladderlectin-like n=1 Tax=Oncorhynchus kisutch TaxID=8019 RepID=UPI0012DEDC8E|nr:ladderlectin-like [Oncorhynchus kisutch]
MMGNNSSLLIREPLLQTNLKQIPPMGVSSNSKAGIQSQACHRVSHWTTVNTPFQETEEVKTQSRLCPSSWTRYGSRCFMFVSTQRTWLEAEPSYSDTACTLGQTLRPYEEHHFVQELERRHTKDLTYACIVGFDHVQKRVWLWSEG